MPELPDVEGFRRELTHQLPGRRVRREVQQQVAIPVNGTERVVGDLAVPANALGVVVFAHGSGSSRHSPRNRDVAGALVERGLATLLMDLLTEREDADDRRTGRLRFDIGRLAPRLRLATSEVLANPTTAALPVGYFGASTGAAAALLAASRDDRVRAVVSRGGRPDLAGNSLPVVRAPTLLVVGGEDPVVLDLNRQAFDAMGCERDLVVVPGATHLFEEPGALEQVAAAAGDWFARHLAASRPGPT
jgi:dienelactone hydrolase